MLTPADVRRHDANAAYLGVPTTRLMANAGRVVAEEVQKLLKTPSRVLVLAGLGNNGGDGMVAALHLAVRHTVTVLVAGAPDAIKTAPARSTYEHLKTTRARIEAFADSARTKELLRGADLVVDALLGIGVSGTLREPVRRIVKLANAAGKPIVSVDVPTGLGADVAIRPKMTVTLDEAKVGMTRSNSGMIVVRDFGLPPEAKTRCGPGDLISWWRPNAPGSHKGQNGRLLVVAGGPYGGAPVLATNGALRAGIDLVRLYTPGRVVAWAHKESADLIVHPGLDANELVPEDVPAMSPLLEKVDTVLVGPGLGTSKRTQRAILELLKATQRARRPLVLDADTFGVAGRHARALAGRPVLLTPHAGEYRAFTGRRLPKDPKAAWNHLAATARRTQTTILLKGPVDRITDGRVRRENHVHHAAMTRGGTGDVLAGVAAAFVARGATPLEAASSAAFLVGSAGRRLAQVLGHGTLASDIAEAVAQEMTAWTRPIEE